MNPKKERLSKKQCACAGAGAGKQDCARAWLVARYNDIRRASRLKDRKEETQRTSAGGPTTRGETLVSGIRRREFVILVAGAAAWPLAARAQQAVPVSVFVSPVLRDMFAAAFHPFLQGLSETGLCRGSECGDRLSRDGGPQRIVACRDGRSTPPSGEHDHRYWKLSGGGCQGGDDDYSIVFLTGEDPVRIGFVASLQPPRRAQPKWAERKSPVRLGGAEENASNEVWGHPTLHKPTTR
jgi:hypothetical protein